MKKIGLALGILFAVLFLIACSQKAAVKSGKQQVDDSQITVAEHNDTDVISEEEPDISATGLNDTDLDVQDLSDDPLTSDEDPTLI